MKDFNKQKAAKAALYTALVFLGIGGLIIVGIAFPVPMMKVFYYSAIGVLIGFVIWMVWNAFYDGIK
jgi:hypothetical protein